jgi:hypothetical protein
MRTIDPQSTFQRGITGIERSLQLTEHAVQNMEHIECDYCACPHRRAAIAALTRTEHWQDLQADLWQIKQWLGDAIAELDDAGTAWGERQRYPDDALNPRTSIENSVAMPLEAGWARQKEQRRRNGAAPSAASIAPVEHRQPPSHVENGDL